MGPNQLPAVGGVDHAVDQVKRRQAFEVSHPEWRAWVDRDRHVWYAERLIHGGRDTHVRYQLRDLLDALGAP